MAKTESTAVNELIGMVQSKRPMASDPAADLFSTPASRPRGRASSPAVAASQPGRMTSNIPPMRGADDVAPLPRARAPQSTAAQSIPSLPDSRVRMSTAPSPRGSTIPPLPPRASSSSMASHASGSLPSRTPAGTLPPPTAPVAAPFEALPATLAKLSSPALPMPRTDLVINPDETWVGTLPTKSEERVALAKKLIAPGIACIAAGIALGFYVSGTKAKSTTNQTPTTASAPSPVTAAPAAPPTETVLHPTARSAESANAGTSTAGGMQPEPPTKAEQAAQVAAVAAGHAEAGQLTSDAPAEAVAKVADAPKGMVKLTDVRIDTEPQGASITLVDRGKQFPLGSTPLSTSLDSSRQYEVIIELSGRPSQTIHLDPATTSRLEIALGRKPRAAAPAVASIAAPKAIAKIEAAPEIAAIEPKKIRSAVETKTDAKPEAAVAANGTLMVSSKPPCEIHIDGAATGLTTPQRSIELAPGKHTITFVNQEAGIKKTVSVTIKAGEPTKLIQDLMTK